MTNENEEILFKMLSTWKAELAPNKLNDKNFWQRNKIAKFIKQFGLDCNRWKYKRGNPAKGYQIAQENKTKLKVDDF